MTQKRFEARVSGRVQGVGFRYYAERQARRLGLTGWVRNLPDGAVELIAEGDESALQQMLDWCHEGPPSAAVGGVQVQWSPALGDLTDFSTRR